MIRRTLIATAPLVMAAIVGINAVAQTTHSATNLDPEFVNKLLKRVEDLEQKAKRVDELESELKNLKSTPTAAPAEVEIPVVRDIYPKIQFNLLGDVDYHVSSDRKDKNTFAQGDIDPVVTAKLSERAGVLGDFVIAANHGGFGFEVERFLLQYSLSDYFNIEAGRYHTAIG